LKKCRYPQQLQSWNYGLVNCDGNKTKIQKWVKKRSVTHYNNMIALKNKNKQSKNEKNNKNNKKSKSKLLVADVVNNVLQSSSRDTTPCVTPSITPIGSPVMSKRRTRLSRRNFSLNNKNASCVSTAQRQCGYDVRESMNQMNLVDHNFNNSAASAFVNDDTSHHFTPIDYNIQNTLLFFEQRQN